uniref:Importin N-terminal domain-containing protein n=1 Tax=Glossina palpalis gambiensis TaxID=67801 RepID=A0A1B0BHQ3_9MUSC
MHKKIIWKWRANNNRIKQASADLRVALRNPITFVALCEIIGSHETSKLRQYSAILLKKHLGKLHNWQMLTLEQQLIVKRVIMNALITEKENLVRNAIAQCVGALIRHDVNTTCSWMDDVAFQILDSMADHTPKLLTNYVKLIVNFCLELAANPQLANAVRVKSVVYVGRLIRLKKKIIIKQELIEHIIQVVFNLMTIETGSCCDDYDAYFLDEDNSNPTAAAMQTMQLMAANIPPGKFISPLLQLVQPALKNQNPLFRRAAYLSMAFIFEGSSKAMCSKWLNNNLNVVGITDIIPVVRNAAFFTLAQFSAHLQEDITRYTPQILPIFLECLQQLCNELRSGTTEPKHINGIFYALKKFCQNVEIVLGPDLHLLMGSVLEILDLKNSLRVRELALYAISAVSTAAKANMLPYLQQVIAILQIYIVKTESENILPLRPQAIDTLAVIALKIGKENFMPLVSDAMGIALTFLEGAKDDPDLRRALYNLIASLAELINEKMASIYPRFIEYLFQSILSTGEVIHEYKEDIFHVHMQENANSEIGIGDADQEDDELFAEYSVDNSLLDEKEQAIWTLKKLADHTGSAFLPYLDQSCQMVYEMIDHPQDDIRRVSINALTSFVIVHFREQNVHDGTYALKILVRKLGHIVREDEEACVVYAALQNFSDLLRELKQNILPAEEIRLADEFDQARQNAAYGLGELVLYAGDKSFQVYPHILTALSQAVSKEFEPAALDNICGTIARLIITNCDLVPLIGVLPKFLQNLPLRKNFEENTLIFKCFKLLYMRARDHLVDLLERMLAIAVHVLYNKQFTDQETFNNAIELLREIRDNYPETFNAVACFNPEILSFFQTL